MQAAGHNACISSSEPLFEMSQTAGRGWLLFEHFVFQIVSLFRLMHPYVPKGRKNICAKLFGVIQENMTLKRRKKEIIRLVFFAIFPDIRNKRFKPPAKKKFFVEL